MSYELIQAREAIIQSTLAMGDVQASHIAIYLTMMFAYIAVAYFVGKSLTHLQLGLTTFVFVLASAREIVNIAALAGSAHRKTIQLAEVSEAVMAPVGGYSIWYSIVIWSTGLIASLVFMWSVRHPKAD